MEVGTRIRFKKTLTAVANEDHPDIQYARKGETGEITRIGGCRERFWVKTDNWKAPFGATSDEFEVLDG